MRGAGKMRKMQLIFLPASPLSTGSSLLDLGVRGETANLPQKSLQLCLCHYLLFLSFWSHLYLDKEAAERLSKTVDEACLLLAEYNGRLAAELEDRRQLARMLVEYTQNQKDVLSEKEKKLENNCPPVCHVLWLQVQPGPQTKIRTVEKPTRVRTAPPTLEGASGRRLRKVAEPRL